MFTAAGVAQEGLAREAAGRAARQVWAAGHAVQVANWCVLVCLLGRGLLGRAIHNLAVHPFM